MPNHVTTTCTVIGPAADVERFRQDLFVADDPKALFDFNKIIPMPESVRATYEEKGGAEIGVALILAAGGDAAPFSKLGLYDHDIDFVRREAGLPGDAAIGNVASVFLEKKPEIASMGRNRLRAVLETGYTYWYPWCIAHWGTKWDSYSVEIVSQAAGRFEFKFETAWSVPEPILAALVDKYPALTFDLLSFDEGWNFAAKGQLGAAVSEPFAHVEPTDALYEAVYGEPPEHEDAA